MRHLAAGFFLLIGVLALSLGAWSWLQGRASASWPTVTGTMLVSEVVADVDVDGGGARGARHARTRQKGFAPHVRFTYEVGGRQFTGSRLAVIEQGSHERAAIERRLATFPVGARVLVHHDPDDPASSVLLPGVAEATWMPMALGALGLAVGTIVLLVTGPAPRRRRAQGAGAPRSPRAATR